MKGDGNSGVLWAWGCSQCLCAVGASLPPPCIPGGSTCSSLPACRQWTGVSWEPGVAFCSWSTLLLWLAAREVWLSAAVQGCNISCLKSTSAQLCRCPWDWHFNWAGVFSLRSSHLKQFNIRLEGKAFSSEMDDYSFKWAHNHLMKWKTKNVFPACDLFCVVFFLPERCFLSTLPSTHELLYHHCAPVVPKAALLRARGQHCGWCWAAACWGGSQLRGLSCDERRAQEVFTERTGQPRVAKAVQFSSWVVKKRRRT